ncbi:MAG: HepT-like ribonuclease domain-containing protein [candidate division KSB1 bacterium]|nr:HepT-like ribonuclease domain-containing protein [candidate division KSB1 bacterium]
MSEKDKINILSILEAIQKIFSYSGHYSSADEFYENQRDFDAAMMNFMVVGEMVARLSDEFIEKHNHIEWQKIRGFRNIIAHNYFGIDAEEVWEIINIYLPKFRNELKAIIK